MFLQASIQTIYIQHLDVFLITSCHQTMGGALTENLGRGCIQFTAECQGLCSIYCGHGMLFVIKCAVTITIYQVP